MEGGLEALDFPEFKLKMPCGAILFGPSQSGKTTFLLKLVYYADKIFEVPPQSVYYCYSDPKNKRIRDFYNLGAVTVLGLPSEELLDKCEKPALIILDDLLKEASESYLLDLFSKYVHHKELAVFFVSQSLYEKKMKIARINSQYLFIMNSPSDDLHIRTLGTQLFTKQLDYFMDAYRQATKENYSYLMINVHPTTKRFMKLCTNIFPDEELTYFIPKSGV